MAGIEGSDEPTEDPLEQMGSRVGALVAQQVMGSLLLVLVLCALCALAIAIVRPNVYRRLLRATGGGLGSSAEVVPGVPMPPSVWATQQSSGRVRSAPGNGVRVVPLEQLLFQSAAIPLPLAAFASPAQTQKPAEH